MLKALTKLVDVKSIMTIVLTVGFVVLTFLYTDVPTEYVDIYKMIVIFYFGTQAGKRSAEEEGGTDDE